MLIKRKNFIAFLSWHLKQENILTRYVLKEFYRNILYAHMQVQYVIKLLNV
jgi:hypothetical protein